MNPIKSMKELDISHLIGAFLIVLPLTMLWGLFAIWPDPGHTAVQEWHRATRDVALFRLEAAKLQQQHDVAKAGADRDAAKKLLEAAQANVDAAGRRQAIAQNKVESSANPDVEISSLSGYSPEARLCMLVVLAGGLGASVAAARGFAIHKGLKDYDPAWQWWYLLRVPTGCGIAFMLYVVLRAGFVPWRFDDAGKALDQVNPYGFVAIGVLAGMFANEAAQKMREILTALWSPGITEKREPPVIDAVRLTDASKRNRITITGRHLSKASQVTVNGAAWEVDPATAKATEIQAVGPADLPPDQTINVIVVSPGAQAASANRTVKL